MHYYTAYRFTLASSLILPEFQETIRSFPDIQISIISESLDNGKKDEEIVVNKLMNGISFDWDGFGRYEIRNGREISVAPREHANQDVTRIPLYNVALAAVLQQKNLLVLHGSAIEINGKAFILLGNKGHGKSSLTVALLKRGHRLLSDDVTAVSFRDTIQVLPGIPIVKLWPDTMKFIGLDVKKTRLFYPGITKRICAIKEQFCNTSLPIGAIFVLNYGKAMTLHNIPALKKLLNLSGYQYFAHFRKAFSLESQRRILEQCRRLAENADMYEFIRPLDLGELEGACRMIETM